MATTSKLLSNSKLPDEIIEKILIPLAVKTLCRFKSVSKGWNLLISSHNFANSHLKNSTDNHERLLFGSDSSPIDKPPSIHLYTCSLESAVEGSVVTIYPPLNENLIVQPATLGLDRPHRNISIVGSCNGLLCLSITVTDLVLWNPTTGQFRTLPNSGTNYLNLDNWDDDCFYAEYAFGHNVVQDDYNVLEYSQYITGQTLLKIYSVRSNSWRTVDWPGPSGCMRSDHGGVFWNGEICWLMEQTLETKQNVVNVVFHQLSADTCMVLPLPSALQYCYGSKYVLTVISGSLAICLLSGISHLEIWFLKKKVWTKEAHLTFPHGHADFCFPLPLFLSPGKVLINYRSNISVCDSSQPDSHQLGYTFDVVATTYTESLISPYIN